MRQSGFTLIELLVALAVSAMIATLSLGGLKLALQSFSAAGAETAAARGASGLARLKEILSQTMPAIGLDPETGMARLSFDGRPDAIDFVTLSEGYALEGGLARMHVECPETKRGSCELKISTSVFRPLPSTIELGDPVVVMGQIRTFSLRYFGADLPAEAPSWHREWRGKSELPLAVEIGIETAVDGPKRLTALLVALRHSTR